MVDANQGDGVLQTRSRARRGTRNSPAGNCERPPQFRTVQRVLPVIAQRRGRDFLRRGRHLHTEFALGTRDENFSHWGADGVFPGRPVILTGGRRFCTRVVGYSSLWKSRVARLGIGQVPVIFSRAARLQDRTSEIAPDPPRPQLMFLPLFLPAWGLVRQMLPPFAGPADGICVILTQARRVRKFVHVRFLICG
jgi:hypothetical protein